MSNVYTCPEFRMDIHYEYGATFMHCEVFQYSKEVKQDIKRIIEIIKTACRENSSPALMAVLEDKKFAKIMGGIHMADIKGEGRELGVFRWET